MSELSYHNSDAVKRRFVSMAKHHRDADMLEAGTYGDEYDGKFLGCSVGCLAYEIDPEESENFHLVVAHEAGLPNWLIHLQDVLFEGLPLGEREDFHVNLYEAIPVGVDLEPVRHQLAILRMDRLIEQEDDDEVVKALKLVRDGHQSELDGKEFDWVAAKNTAWSVAMSARSVARSAETAARSAETAAWSAVSVAESAASSAASSAAYQRERDDLLRLLRATGRQ